MSNRKDHQKFNKIQELEEFERLLLNILPLCLFVFRDGIKKKKTKIGASFSFGKKAKISKWQWI
jgi:hypothetical protein